ncbi:putative C2H2 finger domain protein [Emericellopsis atlantica]|uniref:C2H2 finger domain protein n=1 Tax=Emericellopsis atlantica TaxID=2614577 RepID=A0A9P8CK54_9HYPO|nr:putative C2H2 finger domain protein [Emericellopsis atlantica]KAG9250199.1 putative C2H2 finger domain protein [Emericellopsis atlantica]
MASLREIMNADEDSPDSDSIKRGHRAVQGTLATTTDPLPSTSTYASPTGTSFDILSAQRTQTKSPSGPLPRPSAPKAVSSSPVSSVTGSRSGSTHSSSKHPMDPSYYGHGHGYMQGSVETAAAPSRSYVESSGTEAPVKLTPITGRVSRAKKGVPVHICDICQKTFTRAEHLRRHKLSHLPPDIACTVPGCDKVFHRRDLFERHQQRQYESSTPRAQVDTADFPSTRSEQEIKMAGDSLPGPNANAPSRGGSYLSPNTASHSYPPVTSTMGGSMPGYADVAMAEAPWDSMGGSDLYPSASGLRPAPGDAANHYRMSPMYPGAYPSVSNHWAGSDVSPATSGSSSSSSGVVADPALLQTSGLGASWTDPVGPNPALGSPSYYAYTTSPPQVSSSTAYDTAMGLVVPDYNEGGAVHSPDALLHNTVREPSPPLAVAQSSETLVTMPAAVPTTARVTGGQGTDAPGLAMPSAPVAPTKLGEEVLGAIPTYLEVYWDTIHPLYPFIHRHTLEEKLGQPPEHLDLLRRAMAAVATQFLQDKTHRINGSSLQASAWHGSKVYTEAEEWPLPIMQTILLCEYYSRFRGRKKQSHRPSLRFARLYQMVVDGQQATVPTAIRVNSLSSWYHWIDMESRRRLLDVCFLLDVHSMCYYEQPGLRLAGLDYSNPYKLPIPLSASSVRLWEATERHAWSHLVPSAAPLQTIATALSVSITAEDIAAMPQFDAAILLCAYLLALPKRKELTQVSTTGDLKLTGAPYLLATIFPTSHVANTYLALHYTPLHILLSVSGESWVFNKKIVKPTLFLENRRTLEAWRQSSDGTMAVSFAARAIGAYLQVDDPQSVAEAESFVERRRGSPWNDLSDFWGLYVCTLICWAYGRGCRASDMDASRRAGLRWILEASRREPAQWRDWREAEDTLGVVCLVRDVLTRDCVGGRNILFADSVRVLRRLGGLDAAEWSE